MTRVNMGDRPAPAIATEALFATAEKFKDDFPRAAKFVGEGSYVDDLIDSVDERAEALSKETESLLCKGGFEVKDWRITGVSANETDSTNGLKGDEEITGVSLRKSAGRK